jgi:putative RNA 2'-phosphotransferase
MTMDDLRRVVTNNDKQRYAFSPDETLIRANQGHSMEVELDLPVKAPPAALYHGTVGRFMAAIRKQGLLPQKRHDVHLSATRETAADVGARRGTPIILVVETFPMVRDGFQFKISENGVWLVDRVPAKYIQFPKG